MWTRFRLFKRKAERPGERRGVPRYRLEVPLTVIGTAGQSYRGFTRDLSEGGMGAVLSAELAVGEQVWLLYQLPDGSPPKKVQATVQWREGSRYGFRFVEP